MKLELLIEEKFDCIWVVLEKRKLPQGFQTNCLQLLNWKMGGTLERFVQKTLGGPGSQRTNFFPTQRRLKSPLIALDFANHFDLEAFGANINGIQAQSLCCLMESDDLALNLKKSLEKAPFKEKLQRFCLIVDHKS